MALGGHPAHLPNVRFRESGHGPDIVESTRLTQLGHELDLNAAAQQSSAVPMCAIYCVESAGGTGSETARLHHAPRRRGDRVATRGAGAARSEERRVGK